MSDGPAARPVLVPVVSTATLTSVVGDEPDTTASRGWLRAGGRAAAIGAPPGGVLQRADVVPLLARAAVERPVAAALDQDGAGHASSRGERPRSLRADRDDPRCRRLAFVPPGRVFPSVPPPCPARPPPAPPP